MKIRTKRGSKKIENNWGDDSIKIYWTIVKKIMNVEVEVGKFIGAFYSNEYSPSSWTYNEEILPWTSI